VASIEITADGRHLYTASPHDEVVGAFARNAVTGSLTTIETEAIDIGIGSPFSGPGSMLKLFKGEQYLLVTRFAGAPPRLYGRSATTGELELLDDDYLALGDNQRASSITFSSQGDNLYVLLRTGAVGNSLRTYAVNTDGESDLIDTLSIEDGSITGVVLISPDDRHVYVNTGIGDTIRLNRDPATGLLADAGEEPEFIRVRTLSPVFSSDGRRLYYRNPISATSPFNALGTLLRDPNSGQLISVLEETGLIDFNEDLLDDSMSLIANERLLVTHDGPNLFRLLPDDSGYVDLSDQIGGSLPTGPVARGALEFSPDEDFMYLGLASFMRDSDGIRIYRNNGLPLPQPAPVPAFGWTGLGALLSMILILSLGWRRDYFNSE